MSLIPLHLRLGHISPLDLVLVYLLSQALVDHRRVLVLKLGQGWVEIWLDLLVREESGVLGDCERSERGYERSWATGRGQCRAFIYFVYADSLEEKTVKLVLEEV